MFNRTHIGQQVSDPRYGNGVIVDFDNNANNRFQVKVDFDRSAGETYRVDGSYYGNQLPTLQFGPLDNWERRTQPQVQDGQFIVVQVDEENWRVAKVKFIDGQPLLYSYVRDDGSPIYHDMKNITWRCAL